MVAGGCSCGFGRFKRVGQGAESGSDMIVCQGNLMHFFTACLEPQSATMGGGVKGQGILYAVNTNSNEVEKGDAFKSIKMGTDCTD